MKALSNQALQSDDQAEIDVKNTNLASEPCKLVWKVAFCRETLLSFFLVKYRVNGKEGLRLWIKGHPWKVLECCSYYFEDAVRIKMTHDKNSTFDSKKIIEYYYKNS